MVRFFCAQNKENENGAHHRDGICHNLFMAIIFCHEIILLSMRKEPPSVHLSTVHQKFLCAY